MQSPMLVAKGEKNERERGRVGEDEVKKSRYTFRPSLFHPQC